MKEKKKLIILTSVILGVLVAVLGVAYAAFTYDRTSTTSELVLGDIYMHYKENNQLMFNDAMPTSIDKYTTYKVNPVMASQEENELMRCVKYYTDDEFEFDAGSTADSFCKGTGTWYGMTIQEVLDENISYTESELPGGFLMNGGQELLDLGIIVQDGASYVVNPIMATQEEVYNELMSCIDLFGNKSFDEGSTVETFCQGTGTRNGMTIQELISADVEMSKEYGFSYLKDAGGQELLDAGIILPQIENLPYFEFTISGKNTYLDEDIWFEIILNHGDDHETRTTRIRDELLRFTLVEVVGEEIKTVLINNKKYDDLSNKRIWVETIKANTTSEINKKYRIYAWISDETVIGNVNEDYTMEEWNDVFASIKVNVTGDFKEKELAYEDKYNVTDASCFTTTLSDGVVAITNYDSSCGSDVVIPKTINGYDVTEISIYAFREKDLTSVVIPNSITTIEYEAFRNNLLTELIFEENSNLKTIESYAFGDNQLTSVEIPNSVISIYSCAFEDNLLTEVIFEENSNLESIYNFAFYGTNVITEVTLPNSVTYFECGAFNDDVIINKNEELICTAGPS